MTVTDPTLRVPCYANFGHERQHHTQSGFRALVNMRILGTFDKMTLHTPASIKVQLYRTLVLQLNC